jgi:CBS domain-containing protein
MPVRVVTVRPDETVQVAIARMLEDNVGSVAVCEGARLVGIFTERDVLRLAGAGQGPQFGELKVGHVMTTRVVTVAPDDDVLAVARLMRERKIRHLPVIQGENLLGIVGIRDVVGTLVERLWRTQDDEARDTVRELMSRAPTR